MLMSIGAMHASPVQLANALLCVALAGFLVYPLRALQRKQRIAKGLKPLDGPKGVLLLGILPKYIANKNRIYEFLVRDGPGSSRCAYCVISHHERFDSSHWTTTVG